MSIPFKPQCLVIKESLPYKQVVARSIRSDFETLTVEVQGVGFSFAKVEFEGLIGFRVLDERELGEFWPEYSLPNGWLFEVLKGGWLELEKQREGWTNFIEEAREFMIMDYKCINVICTKPPRLVSLGSSPENT